MNDRKTLPQQSQLTIGLLSRRPKKSITAAVASGKSGISQMWSRKYGCAFMPGFSPFQHVHFVREQRLAIAEKRQDDAQPDGGFRGCVGDDKNCEDLTVQVAEHMRERHQVDVHGVQNQLDRHQDDNHVATREHADDAYGEQREAKPKIMIHGNHYSLRFAITTAPIMATRSKIDAISKGSMKRPKSASATASVFLGKTSGARACGNSDV